MAVDVDDSFGKRLGRFLRQIVTDAALDDPVRIFAGEFHGVGTALRVWRTIGIAFKRNRGHGDHRAFGQGAFPDRRIAPRRQPGCAASGDYESRWRC
jgi:hypothetical protein